MVVVAVIVIEMMMRFAIEMWLGCGPGVEPPNKKWPLSRSRHRLYQSLSCLLCSMIRNVELKGVSESES